MDSQNPITELGARLLSFISVWLMKMKYTKSKLDMIRSEVEKYLSTSRYILTGEATRGGWGEILPKYGSIPVSWSSLAGNALEGRSVMSDTQKEFSEKVTKLKLEIEEEGGDFKDALLKLVDAQKLLLTIEIEAYIGIFDRLAEFLIQKVPDAEETRQDVAKYLPELKGWLKEKH